MDQPNISATEVVPRTLWHTIFLWCGLLGSLLFNVGYFSFGAIAVHYNMMRQPIGDLELLRHGWIQSANFIVFGLTTGLFGLGLRKELQYGFGSTILPVFHLLTAVGLMLMGMLIYEPAHTYISILAFVTLPITFLLFAGRFTGDPRWKGWPTYTYIATILMLLFFIVFWFARLNERPYSGVYERLIVVTRLVWMIAFILKLLSGRSLAPAEQF